MSESKGPTLTPAPDRTDRIGIAPPDPHILSRWQTARPASLREVDTSSPTEQRLGRLERELAWLWRAGLLGWIALAAGLSVAVWWLL